MKHCLPSVVIRCVLAVLFLAALGSCTAYHKVFHPYRLPTPKASPEFRAQQKEAEARKKKQAMTTSLFNKKQAPALEEAATDISSPTGGPLEAAATPGEARKLPEGPTVRYNKQEMMKKPKLMRRRRHKGRRPFRPIQSVRNLFKYGFHAKPNYDPDHRPAPKVPAPDAEPAADPAGDGKP